MHSKDIRMASNDDEPQNDDPKVSQKKVSKYRPRPASKIREQMSGPDLHVFTLQFFSPKKTGFSPIKNTFQFFLTFFYPYSMHLFRALQYSKKKFRLFFLFLKT